MDIEDLTMNLEKKDVSLSFWKLLLTDDVNILACSFPHLITHKTYFLELILPHQEGFWPSL